MMFWQRRKYPDTRRGFAYSTDPFIEAKRLFSTMNCYSPEEYVAAANAFVKNANLSDDYAHSYVEAIRNEAYNPSFIDKEIRKSGITYASTVREHAVEPRAEGFLSREWALVKEGVTGYLSDARNFFSRLGRAYSRAKNSF